MVKVVGMSLQNGDTKSCGCLSDEMKRSRTGDKNPNYNPNLTDEEREVGRKYPEIAKWAIDVKELDKFTCQTCGDNRGGNLESHHLNGYKDFPKQRLNLENGVTLCEPCHKEFHSWMGGNQVQCVKGDFVKFCNECHPNALFITLLLQHHHSII